MLKYFLRGLLILVALAMIPVAIGYFLPRDYSIEAQIEIAAPSDKVFKNINALREWKTWSPWNSNVIDDLTIKYSGPESGVKSAKSWREPRGTGKLWITESVEPSLIEYKMQFEGFPEMESKIELSSTEVGTQVVWKSSGELPAGSFYGWTSFIFERQMTAEYKRALGKLKELCETEK